MLCRALAKSQRFEQWQPFAVTNLIFGLSQVPAGGDNALNGTTKIVADDPSPFVDRARAKRFAGDGNSGGTHGATSPWRDNVARVAISFDVNSQLPQSCGLACVRSALASNLVRLASPR